MTGYSIATGLIMISSFFILTMWAHIVWVNIKTNNVSIMGTKLIITGGGLFLQSIFLVTITFSRSIQIYAGHDMTNYIMAGMFGLVICDFLFILAASIARPKKTMLNTYLVCIATWLAFVTFYHIIPKGS